MEYKEKKRLNIGKVKDNLVKVKLRRTLRVMRVLAAHKVFQRRWIANVRHELFYVNLMANIVHGLRMNKGM